MTQTLSIINPNNSKMTDYDKESSLTQTEEDDSGATTYEQCSSPNYEVSTPQFVATSQVIITQDNHGAKNPLMSFVHESHNKDEVNINRTSTLPITNNTYLSHVETSSQTEKDTIHHYIQRKVRKNE